MVCKEDVVLWFRELSGHKRIDVMCSLLNKCLPFELRFFGTCLEDLGKQYFNQMKDVEVKANNPAELSELLVQCIISDTRTRQKLALYICLIHSLNTTCSTNLYKTLSVLNINQIIPLVKNSDDKLLEELLLIYTIAINHPAFTFEQKANLGSILLRLRQEEDNLLNSKLPEALNEDYVNSVLNLSPNSELSTGNNLSCPEMPPQNIPPGLSYPPGLGAPTNYIPMPYAPFPLQHPPYVWQLVNVNLQSMPTEPITITEMPPNPATFSCSSHPSRQSSPSQSASASHTTSPTRKAFHQQSEQSNSQPCTRPAYSDAPFSTPPPSLTMTSATKPSYETSRESKETAPKVEEDMQGLTDGKTEPTSDEIEQLRTAVVNMNGITDLEHRNYSIVMSRQNVGIASGYEDEIPFVPVIPRPLNPTMLSNQPPSIVPSKPCCIAQIGGTGPRYQQAYCQHSLQALSLDNEGSRHCSSSSSSDASSTSHSPPATPANLNPNWERGYASGVLMDKCHEPPAGAAAAPPKPDRGRMMGGRGRSRINNPLGVQTLPRGRGPHSVAMDSGHKSQTGKREPRSAPPTPHEEKKIYGEISTVTSHVTQTSMSPLVTQSTSMKLPPPPLPPVQSVQSSVGTKPPELVASGVPYTNPNPPPAPFLPPAHFSAPPLYPPYGTFVRPTYPFPNGTDMMYPYQPQQPPFPVHSPVVPFPTNLPPPKVACYNCSSPNHHANECKEPTMEEYTSKGQYRIDYKPYNKQGECLSEK